MELRPHAEDTIAAGATPAGRGWRALVRISGRDTFAILGPLVGDLARAAAPGGAAVERLLRIDAATRVPVRVLCFRAPRSYTGEDVAEVHLPGSPQLVAAVLEVVFRGGARPAAPGEFTRRAYLAGRLDLTRAEGIQALVAARDDAERRGALALTGGQVAGRVEALRASLLALLADLEATLDFPEHEIGPGLLEDLGARLDAITRQLNTLIRMTRDDARPPAAPRAILWGRPNAGKSTLFNALVGRNRVAVSDVPGTTRDVLGGRVFTPRGEILLFDAPGVGLESGREADAAARRTAAGLAEPMDLRIVVAGVEDARRPTDPGAGDCLLVLAKTDLRRRLDPSAWIEAHRPVAVVGVSVRAGRGLDRLRRAIGEWRASTSPGQDVVVCAGRLRALFLRAVDELARLRAQHAQGFGPECLSVHVRALLSALEEVTGRVFTDEILDHVFSRFCVGK